MKIGVGLGAPGLLVSGPFSLTLIPPCLIQHTSMAVEKQDTVTPPPDPQQTPEVRRLVLCCFLELLAENWVASSQEVKDGLNADWEEFGDALEEAEVHEKDPDKAKDMKEKGNRSV